MCKTIFMDETDSVVALYKNTVFIENIMNEGFLTKEKVKEISDGCSIELPNGGYRIALITIDHEHKADVSQENMRLALACLINNVSSEYGYISMAAKISDKDVMAILYECPRERFRDINGLLSTVMGRFMDMTDCTITVGISSYFSDITDIYNAYSQAHNALECRTVLGNNRVIDYKSLPETPREAPVMYVNDMQLVCDQIRSMNAGKAVETVEKYFDAVSKCGRIRVDDVKNTMMMLAMLLLHDKELGTITVSAFNGKFDPSFELSRCELLNEIKDWIVSVIRSVSEYMDIFIDNEHSRMVREAIIYTMRNFDKPLTTSIVADHLHVSVNHFMRIFKKEQGITYGEYLAEHRILQAKKLLKTNKYRIYEVSDMVGYNNPAYFNRLFKKYTGHNPGYYCKGGDHEETA